MVTNLPHRMCSVELFSSLKCMQPDVPFVIQSLYAVIQCYVV